MPVDASTSPPRNAAKPSAAALSAWFREHRRDLPWRVDRTPYRVWLAEVMLQQTRVSVVVDYYLRFLARFPTVADLAAASEDEVLSLWAGLGYYSRGRNLHKAARAVTNEHGGVFPASAAGLSALPGVGEYTAAATAAFAYNERVPVVDGNVARVLQRHENDATLIDSPAGKRRVRAAAAALLDDTPEPGWVSEAVIELGALVCTPKAPRCDACPWRTTCQARAAGTVLELPKKTPKKQRKALHVASLVLFDDEHLWLERRPSAGLFGGLFEPPSRVLTTDALDDVHAAWRELLRERGLVVPATFAAPLQVERTLTHRDLRFFVLPLRLSAASRPGPWWLRRDALQATGTSTAVRAVLDAALPK